MAGGEIRKCRNRNMSDGSGSQIRSLVLDWLNFHFTCPSVKGEFEVKDID